MFLPLVLYSLLICLFIPCCIFFALGYVFSLLFCAFCFSFFEVSLLVCVLLVYTRCPCCVPSCSHCLCRDVLRLSLVYLAPPSVH